MAEFEVDGISYRSGKLDAMTQGLIAKRFAPAIFSLGLAASSIKPAEGKDEAGEEGAKGMDALERLAGPVSEAIAKMSDDDFTFVVSRCMAVTQRQRPGDTGYTAIWNEAAKKPMFDDINVFSMLTITGQVLIDQIGPFGSTFPLGFNR